MNKKGLKKKAAAVAVSFVMAGSAGAAASTTVFAEDTSDKGLFQNIQRILISRIRENNLIKK